MALYIILLFQDTVDQAAAYVSRAIADMLRYLDDIRITKNDIEWLMTKANSLHYLFNNITMGYRMDDSVLELLDAFRVMLNNAATMAG